jgi:hypothetical protein
MLIKSYSERCSRANEKKKLILEFLRDETWTTAQVVSLLIRLSMASAYKTLNRMKKEGLIVSHFVNDLNMTIWGITTLGLMDSWSYSEIDPQDRPYFQKSRIKAVMVKHHLMLQQARIQAELLAWKNWIPGNLLPKDIDKRPDAIVTSNLGQNIAVELERTLKTKKRYEMIISLYLQAIKRQDYDEVHYVVTDKSFASSLRRLFGLISHVPVSGERVAINQAKHLSKFVIYELDNWPD